MVDTMKRETLTVICSNLLVKEVCSEPVIVETDNDERRLESRQIDLSNSIWSNLSSSLFQKFDKTNLWKFFCRISFPVERGRVGVLELTNFLGLAGRMIILQKNRFNGDVICFVVLLAI